MTRYRSILAYDGTAYHGYQRQKNALSVQGELEKALGVISGGETVRVLAAGRTDTGVHATGQVIAFDLAWRHDPGSLRDAVNAHLPQDIALQAVEVAKPEFHPRYDAISREYEYRLYLAPTRDPLRSRRAWHLRTHLNDDEVRQAAESLLGTHDFSTFGAPPQGDNPVRTVFQSRWEEHGDERRFIIQANAFLFRMVRRITGTLVRVGSGQMRVEEFQAAFAARKLRLSAPPAPPYGLTLVAVSYDE